jgi:hypothetical protein
VPGVAGTEAIVLFRGVLQTEWAAYEPGDFLHIEVASGPPLRAGVASPCLYLYLVVGDDTLNQPPFRNWRTRGRGA